MSETSETHTLDTITKYGKEIVYIYDVFVVQYNREWYLRDLTNVMSYFPTNHDEREHERARELVVK